MYVYLFSFLQHSSNLSGEKLLTVGAFNRERKPGTSDQLVLMLNRTHLLEVGLQDFS